MEKNLPINKEPFKRIDYLRQPNSISLIQFRMELVQLRAFACYLEKLEPMFLELIDLYNKDKNGEKKKISITQTKSIKEHLNDDNQVEFKINFSELKIGHTNYGKAREQIGAMVNLIVRIPIYRDGKLVEYQDSSAFTITTEAENGKSRCNYFKIAMLKSVLDSFVDIRMGYHDQLKRIVFLSSNIYTARLYVLVTGRTHRNATKLEVPLEDFRRFMGLYKKISKNKEQVRYRRYCDLERRLIKPAVEELKKIAESGNSDFWVEVERKDVGEDQNPSAFIITVHESQVAKLTRKENIKDGENSELLSLLYNELKQPKANVTKLMERVTPMVKKEFTAEVRRAIDHIKGRPEIKKPVSYAWQMLNTWLDVNAQDVTDVTEVNSVEEEKPQPDAAPKEPIQQELFPVEDERWDKFQSIVASEVGSMIYNTWLVPMKLISADDGIVTVQVPNYVVHQWINENIAKEVTEAIQSAFGKEYQLRYTYASK